MTRPKKPSKHAKPTRLVPRLTQVEGRRTSPLNAPSRKPWGSVASAPGRLRGLTLQNRNHRIKLRDKYTCAACGRISNDHEVDHIVPMFKGGSDGDHNLQLLCSGIGNCHDQKSRKERVGTLAR